MFDNDIFEKWLDSQAQAIVDKMGQGAQLRTEEMMILVLKAQSNHFHHLDKDLHNEMITLRGDMRDEMITLRTDMRDEMKTLREDMDRRFESVDKRFEQVIRRMDRFMFWSLGVTVAAAAFVVTYLK
uniref:DUF1640 domain-containing protein n=1 Tax=Candidatus Kentrum sp. LPFa TaxID=2126335 RepID=A0A450Y249_9GAMM|nr:MAG: hypothetical protein BECKLPF1236A_GA0070988_103921 [Candidatus Kentron sp. LPFa]VFK35623.1 MAG: hypothetical protein BECKLPF1236C_GA0070990_104001 [Candidatus Kentron sp. LPFa]